MLAGAGGGVPGVDGGAHAGRQGVHGVEDEGLDAGDSLGAGAQDVVKDGVEEGLGLT